MFLFINFLSVDNFYLLFKVLNFLWLIWLQISYMATARRVAKLEKEGAKIGIESPLTIALRERDAIGGVGNMTIIFFSTRFFWGNYFNLK